MINTVNIKSEQLSKGFLTVGGGSEVMLIMGSCRIAPLVNYFNDWNEANGNRYTIHTLDCFNWNWDVQDNRVDYLEKLKTLETDERILTMLKSVDVFIHEFYKNAGMFNCDKESDTGIYAHGMNPKIDVCIPSWNDHFVLFGDIVTFDTEMRKKAMADWNVLGKLSEQTFKDFLVLSWNAINKFLSVCNLSDLPEMGEYFIQNFRYKRLWFTYNHTTKNFTLEVFRLMNEKYLHLDLSKGWNPDHEDMFKNNYTKTTKEDIEAFGYQWENEEIVPFRDKLFG